MPTAFVTRHHDELIKLIELKQSEFEKLVSALVKRIELQLYPGDSIRAAVEFWRSELDTDTDTDKDEDMDSLVRFIFSLCFSFTDQHLSINEFSNTVVAKIQLHGEGEIQEKKILALRQRLENLLEIKTLLLSIKAMALASKGPQYELIATKHICDLRPVYLDRRENFAHAILLQTLFVTIRDSAGQVSELGLSIDPEQIDNLISDLLDAKSKCDGIVEHCKKTNLTLIPE